MSGENSVQLDDILKKIKPLSKYNLLVTALLTFGTITNAISNNNFVFTASADDYKCKTNSSQDLISAKGKTNQGNLSSSGNEIDTLPESCEEWIYEDPNSFVAEFHLAQMEWKRTLVGTLHMTGMQFNYLLLGLVSDRFGRKPILIITGIMSAVIRILQAFSVSYWMFIAMEFLGAFIGDTGMYIYIMSVEIAPKSRMIVYQAFYNVMYILGAPILAVTAWSVPYWRTLLIALFSPSLLFIFYITLLDESPRWLISRNRKEEAYNILKKAFKVNKVEFNESDFKMLECKDNEESLNLISTIKMTFKSRTLFIRLLIVTFCCFACNFCSYGLIFNSVFLSGNKYVNFVMVAMSEVFSSLLMMLMNKRITTRSMLVMGNFFIGVACIAQPFAAGISGLNILLYAAGSCFSGLAFTVTYVVMSEIFPTYTRNTIQGLASAIGKIGSIIAPQTPLLFQYSSSAPIILFGACGLIAAFLSMFLPDTSNAKLPENVAQAENVGMKKISI